MSENGLTLTPEVLERMRAHARSAYPNECCGALVGHGRDVVDAFELPNTTEEGPRRRFLVRPSDYRTAERRAADRRADLIAFYHSHPDHAPRPSQYDLDHAWPFFSYVIVSVDQGEPGDIKSWRLKDDRSAFEEESLLVWQTRS